MSTATTTDQIMRSLPTMSAMCIDHDPEVFRSVLERVGGKWSLLVIGLLSEQSLRFTELATTIPGISRRMLTITLRGLERDGLITRTVYAEVPPRVVYAATDLGRSLGQCVRLLGSWVAENQGAIVKNRESFDEARA